MPGRFATAVFAIAFIGCAQGSADDRDASGNGMCGASTDVRIATSTDDSAVVADGSVMVVLANPTVKSDSAASSIDGANIGGLGAALLAKNGGSILMHCGSIKTTGVGTNGAFADGSLPVMPTALAAGASTMSRSFAVTSIALTDVSIDCGGDFAHGVAAALGGVVTLTNVDITTHGAGSSAFAVERGGGTFTMTGGSLSNTSSTGALFSVTDGDSFIALRGVVLNIGSGVLVRAAGGNVMLVAEGEMLRGAINGENTAKSIALTLDANSTWTVTADSWITTLTDPAIDDASARNIIGDGHIVHYDATANDALGGRTYALERGGTLAPN